MIRCLLVDDDREILEALQDYLQRFGMQVSTAADGAQARRLLAAPEAFDVAILDVMLPDESGLALCKWLRESSELPVVMLTARGDPMSRVLGLELGADDYLAKPFEPRELVARLHAVTRRTRRGAEPGAARTVPRASRFAGWVFDRLRRELVSPAQVVVALSSAEYRLLAAFVDHPGRVLSRERLIDLTRAAGAEINDRAIDLAVSRLRGKLGDNPREPRLIRTMRGEGYLFDARVES